MNCIDTLLLQNESNTTFSQQVHLITKKVSPSKKVALEDLTQLCFKKVTNFILKNVKLIELFTVLASFTTITISNQINKIHNIIAYTPTTLD